MVVADWPGRRTCQWAAPPPSCCPHRRHDPEPQRQRLRRQHQLGRRALKWRYANCIAIAPSCKCRRRHTRSSVTVLAATLCRGTMSTGPGRWSAAADEHDHPPVRSCRSRPVDSIRPTIHPSGPLPASTTICGSSVRGGSEQRQQVLDAADRSLQMKEPDARGLGHQESLTHPRCSRGVQDLAASALLSIRFQLRSARTSAMRRHVERYAIRPAEVTPASASSACTGQA